jgi:hypothetical protein
MFVTAPIAIFFGHKGLRETRRTSQPGRNMALAGLALGYLIAALVIALSIWMGG